jgi:hypothetical protein
VKTSFPDKTIPYVDSSTKLIVSNGYTSFFSHADPESCQLEECQILEQGCITPETSSEFELSPTQPH